jgi:hypothetical protein
MLSLKYELKISGKMVIISNFIVFIISQINTKTKKPFVAFLLKNSFSFDLFQIRKKMVFKL